jgi:phosphatidylinositol 4-phosphatase
MRWHRISLLIDKVGDDLERDGYFQIDANRVTPSKSQKGTVRTNCMDNLDRTNVVQAALAKWTLGMQLADLDILPAGRTIDDYEELSRDVRESECITAFLFPYVCLRCHSVG